MKRILALVSLLPVLIQAAQQTSNSTSSANTEETTISNQQPSWEVVRAVQEHHKKWEALHSKILDNAENAISILENECVKQLDEIVPQIPSVLLRVIAQYGRPYCISAAKKFVAFNQSSGPVPYTIGAVLAHSIHPLCGAIVLFNQRHSELMKAFFNSWDQHYQREADKRLGGITDKSGHPYGFKAWDNRPGAWVCMECRNQYEAVADWVNKYDLHANGCEAVKANIKRTNFGTISADEDLRLHLARSIFVEVRKNRAQSTNILIPSTSMPAFYSCLHNQIHILHFISQIVARAAQSSAPATSSVSSASSASTASTESTASAAQ